LPAPLVTSAYTASGSCVSLSGARLLGEVARAIGLKHPGCAYPPSAFCAADWDTTFTSADLIVLRTLYDPHLKPGMSREEAMPIAREIIRELWVD